MWSGVFVERRDGVARGAGCVIRQVVEHERGHVFARVTSAKHVEREKCPVASLVSLSLSLAFSPSLRLRSLGLIYNNRSILITGIFHCERPRERRRAILYIYVATHYLYIYVRTNEHMCVHPTNTTSGCLAVASVLSQKNPDS